MKKLTAGIFTALLGLVTVNAANAAIPSTTYVDTKITTAQEAAQDYADTKDAALKTAIETDYKAADTALDGKITTNANAISAMDTAYKAADTALDGRVDTLETTVGSGAMTVNGAAQADVIAAINALDTKTNGIASEGALTTLQETVSKHTTDISGLEGRMTAAEGEIDTLQSEMDAVEGVASDNANAIATLNGDENTEGSVAKAEADAKAYADGLNTAADGRLDALEAKDVVLNTAIEANAAAIESNETDIASLQSKDTELAGLISGNATEIAKKADATATTQALATKAAKDGYTASQVVVTDSTGAIATAAQIPNTQVSGLGDLATKSTIADADVAADAAIAQSKIAGLTDALANTTPKVTARGEAGTYVLTAIVSDSGATSYQWEQIERPTTGGEG